jgi:hypothetical protein
VFDGGVCMWVCVGAVALGTGNTIGGATSHNNTSVGLTTPPGTTGAPVTDVHLRSVCQASAPNTAMANQSLFDLAALEFDLTPAVSGPLVFGYVFGSEEYFKYSPVSFRSRERTTQPSFRQRAGRGQYRVAWVGQVCHHNNVRGRVLLRVQSLLWCYSCELDDNRCRMLMMLWWWHAPDLFCRHA